MNSNQIDALQQLTAEEVEQVAGAGNATCSPSFTCARTTCSETVVVDTEDQIGG